jgi:hypothetical protein
MQRHMKVKAALAAVAIAGGATVATLGSASPALGFFSPPLSLQITVDSPGTLVAGGAGVNVDVTVECAGTGSAGADVFLRLTERSGSQIANGYGSTVVGCTNSKQTVVVLVTGQSGKVFKVGSAIASGNLSGCTPSFSVCGTETDNPTISITK